MPLPDPHDTEQSKRSDLYRQAFAAEDNLRNELLALQKENTELRMSIRRVVRAIRHKGPVPKYHDQLMQKHREQWPRLWLMIDLMLKSYDKAISREST